MKDQRPHTTRAERPMSERGLAARNAGTAVPGVRNGTPLHKALEPITRALALGCTIEIRGMGGGLVIVVPEPVRADVLALLERWHRAHTSGSPET